MSLQPAKEKNAKERFWERFMERARTNGVKEMAIRWHVRRAETYLKAFPSKRLAQHRVDDVAGYLEQAGRLDRITDWQFVQTVDAIQNLLETAKAPVAEQVDWTFWRDSARSLELNHPTVAHEVSPGFVGATEDAMRQRRVQVQPLAGVVIQSAQPRQAAGILAVGAAERASTSLTRRLVKR